MSIWRRLGPRIIGISVILSVSATLMVNLVFARLTLQVAASRAGDFLQSSSQGVLGERCRSSPHAFYLVEDDVELWALDQSLRSHHTKTPEVPTALMERLRQGQTHASEVGLQSHPWGGVMVQRVAADGPCAVFVARWKRSGMHVRRGLAQVGAVLLAATLLAILCGLVFIVRPLTRRIQDLQAAASHIGDTQAYEPMYGAAIDELDAVRNMLDDAHARIVTGAEALADKNRALATHLSDVAHDLRTPIAALQLKLERLGHETLTEEERSTERLAALADALYLEALCENLRFAATLREGLELESSRCDLGRVAVRVRDRLDVVARRRGVLLDVAVPDDEVIAPMARVVAERILGNLVINAIVHRAPDHPQGHVAVVLARTQGGFELRVVDDGPGLPDDVQARLLTYSEHAGPVWNEAGGTGLGLRIVSALCARSDVDMQWRNPEAGGLEVVLAGRCV